MAIALWGCDRLQALSYFGQASFVSCTSTEGNSLRFSDPQLEEAITQRDARATNPPTIMRAVDLW
ncbi:MAG: hypothetical protein ACYT04_45100 [Nostoc sp.]